jgi:3',5'-cyclic AMP phosphodiesterase CpdA
VASSSAGPWTETTAVARAFPISETGDSEAYVAFDASVTMLEPDRAYCYEVLVDGQPVATGLTFHTAWDGDERPVRVLAFGDSGKANPSQIAVRDAFMQRDFDVFLHLGDMAYGSGTHTEFEERVFAIYRDFMHKVPSFPTIGNHEYKTNKAQPYLDVYYLFEQAWRDADQERYYSFDYGNVHFVSLDSNGEMLLPIELDFQQVVDDDMIDWLVDDLAASEATWKIAFFHHPPFSLYESRSDNNAVLNQIMPALSDGDVDLILVGHDHHYVRSLPIRGDCKVPGGDGAIPFILVGSGGTELHAFEDPDDWYVAAGNDQIHAFLSLTIHGCSGKGEAIDINGQTIDSFELNGCK